MESTPLDRNITSDLSKVPYQIPLRKSSMTYCVIVTPFCGVQLYTQSAKGILSSEIALEELICHILSDLVQVAKFAMDLYCGDNISEKLFSN